MLETILLPVTKHPVVTLTFLIVLFRMFRPMMASDNKPSWTLTGLFCTTMIIFMVTIIDSINDRPDVSSQTTAISTRKGKKVSRRTRGRGNFKTAKARGVVKEKYGILGSIWIGFMLLYLLSHKGKDIWSMMLRFMMAGRGKFNPMPNDDPMDNYLVSLLKEDLSPITRAFAVRMTLARKGIVMDGPVNGKPPQEEETKEVAEVETTGLMKPSEEVDR